MRDLRAINVLNHWRGPQAPTAYRDSLQPQLTTDRGRLVYTQMGDTLAEHQQKANTVSSAW